MWPYHTINQRNKGKKETKSIKETKQKKRQGYRTKFERKGGGHLQRKRRNWELPANYDLLRRGN